MNDTALCGSCGEPLFADEIALSKKMLGRQIKTFFCLDCLAEYFGETAVDMRALIKDFRQAGCGLFG